MSYNEQIAKDLTMKMGEDLCTVIARNMEIMSEVMPMERVIYCISIALVAGLEAHIAAINTLTGHKMDAENKAMVMNLFNS